MKQQTLAMAGDFEAGFERYRRPPRRDEFLATMNSFVPWAALCEVVQPYYPGGMGGRPPMLVRHLQRTASRRILQGSDPLFRVDWVS
jgi:IS5 family transposase